MLQNFMRLRSGLPIDALVAALDRQPGLWQEITTRQKTPGSAHHDTEAIFLRWCKTRTVEAAFSEIPAIDFPSLLKLPEAWPLIEAVLDACEAKELGRVLIVNLRPGGFIDSHADEGAYADHYERFHLPLVSDFDNSFFSEIKEGCGEYVWMKPGEVWWFDHKRKHWVINASNEPRIHLIVDAVAPMFRRERHEVSA